MSATLDAAELERLVRLLAGRFIWIAPVGNHSYGGKYDLRGFMVCKRSINNVDGQGNTRIDYLLNNPVRRGGWKKPFTEDKCMFPTLDAALIAAAKAEGHWKEQKP